MLCYVVCLEGAVDKALGIGAREPKNKIHSFEFLIPLV